MFTKNAPSPGIIVPPIAENMPNNRQPWTMTLLLLLFSVVCIELVSPLNCAKVRTSLLENCLEIEAVWPILNLSILLDNLNMLVIMNETKNVTSEIFNEYFCVNFPY